MSVDSGHEDAACTAFGGKFYTVRVWELPIKAREKPAKQQWLNYSMVPSSTRQQLAGVTGTRAWAMLVTCQLLL